MIKIDGMTKTEAARALLQEARVLVAFAYSALNGSRAAAREQYAHLSLGARGLVTDRFKSVRAWLDEGQLTGDWREAAERTSGGKVR